MSDRTPTGRGSRLRAIYLGLLLVFAGTVSAGCGDDTPSDSGGRGFAASTKGIRDCLSRAGASRATTIADIDFFVDDSEKGEINNPAGAGNGVIGIDEYRPVLFDDGSGGRPDPRYVVWVAQAANEQEIGPLAALDRAETKALVMYVQDPDRRQTRAAARCMDELGTDLPASVGG